MELSGALYRREISPVSQRFSDSSKLSGKKISAKITSSLFDCFRKQWNLMGLCYHLLHAPSRETIPLKYTDLCISLCRTTVTFVKRHSVRCGRMLLLWRGQNKIPRTFYCLFSSPYFSASDGKDLIKTWSLFKSHGNIILIVMENWNLPTCFLDIQQFFCFYSKPIIMMSFTVQGK